jgi:SNF2 family DNA or RNA helicase
VLAALQADLRAQSVPACRIDGTMSAEERASEVEQFQRKGATTPVFLLTSQVRPLLPGQAMWSAM